MVFLYDNELVAEIVEQIIAAVVSTQKRCQYLEVGLKKIHANLIS
jgi:hypothetical protein